MKFPIKITAERRMEDIPKWLPFATSLGAIVISFIISGIILSISGSKSNPGI